MDSTALAEPKVPLRAWLRRTAIACGVLAAMACADALAGDPIADALSLVAQERYAEAHEALQPLVEREPDAPGVRLLRGILNAREGNFLEAIAIFESLRDDHPAMFEAHNNLAVLYAKLGRLNDARETLIAALELRPDAVVYANLGDVYLQLAERAYMRAHEIRAGEDAAPDRGGQAAESSEPTPTPEEPAAVPVMQDEEPATAPTTQAEGPATVPTAPTEELAAVPTMQAETQADTAEAEKPEVPDEPEVSPAQASIENCIRAEWFKDSDSAYEVAAWMRVRGATEIKVRQEEREAIKNHHVYIPPLASRAAASDVAEALRRQGVSDIWIFREGARANGISLGVYRNEQYMRRRVAEIEALGYSVVSAPNMKAVSEFVIEASLGEDRSSFDDAWETAFPEQAVHTFNCADRI